MEFFEWIQGIDLTFVRFVRENLSNGFLDVLMPIVTLFGEAGIVPIVLALIMMFFKKTRKAGITIACSLAMGFIIGNLVLKNIVARPRPYSVDTDVVLLHLVLQQVLYHFYWIDKELDERSFLHIQQTLFQGCF